MSFVLYCHSLRLVLRVQEEAAYNYDDRRHNFVRDHDHFYRTPIKQAQTCERYLCYTSVTLLTLNMLSRVYLCSATTLPLSLAFPVRSHLPPRRAPITIAVIH